MSRALAAADGAGEGKPGGTAAEAGPGAGETGGRGKTPDKALRKGVKPVEWHKEKLLPAGLPEPAYQVTPAEIADRLKVIALPRGKLRRGVLASIDDPDGGYVMYLRPHAICGVGLKRLDVPAAGVWIEYLYVYLHGLGHAVACLDGRDPRDAGRCAGDREYRLWVESLADARAQTMLSRIAARHPYLGQPQPGALGNYPGGAAAAASTPFPTLPAAWRCARRRCPGRQDASGRAGSTPTGRGEGTSTSPGGRSASW
jgi:hypothetical protein